MLCAIGRVGPHGLETVNAGGQPFCARENGGFVTGVSVVNECVGLRVGTFDDLPAVINVPFIACKLYPPPGTGPPFEQGQAQQLKRTGVCPGHRFSHAFSGVFVVLHEIGNRRVHRIAAGDRRAGCSGCVGRNDARHCGDQSGDQCSKRSRMKCRKRQ